jgi:hypothetical protein
MTDTQPRKLSNAQRKRVQALMADRDAAQRQLQEFVVYLVEEHGLPDDPQWTLDTQTWAWVYRGQPAQAEGEAT